MLFGGHCRPHDLTTWRFPLASQAHPVHVTLASHHFKQHPLYIINYHGLRCIIFTVIVMGFCMVTSWFLFKYKAIDNVLPVSEGIKAAAGGQMQ